MIRRALLAVALVVIGCEGDNRVALGRFRVTAARMTNTCGPQASEFAPQFRFDVMVKVGDGLLHWAPLNASEGTGTWNASQHTFRLVQEADFVVTPTDTRRGILGCTLHRTDVIEGTVAFDDADAGQVVDRAVDAGATVRARGFTATESIVYGTTQGYDCSLLIGAQTGQFSAMPCQATYQMAATRVADDGDAGADASVDATTR